MSSYEYNMGTLAGLIMIAIMLLVIVVVELGH